MLERILPWRETCEHTDTERVVDETFGSIYPHDDHGLVAALVSKEIERCVDCGEGVSVGPYHEICMWSLTEEELVEGDVEDIPLHYLDYVPLPDHSVELRRPTSITEYEHTL